MPLTSSSPSTGNLREVLSRRSNARKSVSCDPCRERKVKCDKGQPCGTCSKRCYPDLCTYRSGAARDSAPHMRPARNVTSRALQPAGASLAPKPADNGHQDNPGSLTDVVDAVDAELPDSNGIGALAQGLSPGLSASPHHRAAFEAGIMPLLGLNERAGPGNVGGAWISTYEALLGQPEILNVFQVYRTHVHSFHCIPSELDSVEKRLCLLLHMQENPEVERSPELVQGTEWICLLNAILALGAQASDLPHEQRFSLSQRHTKLAFEALQATNYLSHPYKEAIQALLLLGNVLQNEMRPQSAWSLAGTTIRLAQCLGIHQRQPTRKSSKVSPSDASSLRLAIVWQDSLLSMALGRPPASYEMDIEDDLVDLSTVGNAKERLSYRQAMNRLGHLAFRHLDAPRSPPTLPRCLQFLGEIDSLGSFISLHLAKRQACETVQQVQEHFLFELHRNFTISTICRQLISREGATEGTACDYTYVVTRLQEALKCSAHAYLRLRSTSSYASRSWGFIHNGLTSVLLLSFMKETRHSSETKALQNQIIDSLESEGDSGQNPDSARTWHLSNAHRKALEALKALRRLSDQEAPATISPQTPNAIRVSTPADPNQRAQTQQNPNPTPNQRGEWDLNQWLSFIDFDQEPLDAFDSIMMDSGSFEIS